MTDTLSLTPAQVSTAVEHCISVRRPAFIWGSPGIGKSDVVAQIAKRQNRPLIDIRLLLMMPEDLRGIPYYNPTTNKMVWAEPNCFPSEGEVGLENAIIFFDEMNAAHSSVQAAAYQLILNRRIGDYELPAGVDMVAAGNLESDRSVTHRMPTALANRFVHITMKVSTKDWIDWAVKNGVNSDVVAFIDFRPSALYTFDAKSPDKAFASPRTWVFTSGLIDGDEAASPSDDIMTSLIAGTVGQGLAIEFAAHRRMASSLPKAVDILSGKVKTLKKQDTSIQYAVCYALAYALYENVTRLSGNVEALYADDQWHNELDIFFGFMMKNFQAEMQVLGFRVLLSNFGVTYKSLNLTRLANMKTYLETVHKYMPELAVK